MTKLVNIGADSVPGGRAFLVLRDGATIGMIRKLTNTRTDTFPWQAFGPLVDQMTPRKLLGSFYEPDGKVRAIAAVLK